MKSRLDTFRALCDSHQLPAYLITSDTNIKYLTAFPASESDLLITAKGNYYVTDARYTEEAKQGLKKVQVKEYRQSRDKMVMDLAARDGAAVIGIDAHHLTLARFKHLQKMCPKGIRLKAVSGIVERMRAVKDSGELDLIREALAIHKETHSYLKRIVKPGLTEEEILNRLEAFVKRRKAGFSFPPIVASGPNSSFPHAHVTSRICRRDEPLLIDMGIDWKGYKSDLTRMFFFDKIPPIVREVATRVQEAQQAAIASMKPGVAVAEIDEQARKILRNYKLEKYFSHSLGHGVGLDIHEDPRLSSKSRARLEAGMVVTVEPAVYLPNRFGIRIEDMVLITEKGYEVLSDNIH